MACPAPPRTAICSVTVVLNQANVEVRSWPVDRFCPHSIGFDARERLMKKDMTELPADIQTQIWELEALPDDQIDTTEAPEILDWSDARRGVFHRPVKRQITLRIDADIIAWFKAHDRDGRGYQTDINRALREHIKRETRSANQA